MPFFFTNKILAQAAPKIIAAAINPPTKEYLNHLDNLYDNGVKTGNYAPLYKAFTNEESPENEFLWRRARAFRLYAANNMSNNDQDFEVKRKLLEIAHDQAKHSVERDPNNFNSHKWFAITLSDLSAEQGTKASLLASPLMREHFEKAIQLNPTDPSTLHALGLWHFSFANLGYFKRKAAGAIFAKVPESSYEEALAYFEKAEEVSPGYLSTNW